MITFLCGKCGKRLQVADEVAGKKCRCPSCTTINLVPTSGGSYSNPSASSSTSQPRTPIDLFPSTTSGPASSGPASSGPASSGPASSGPASSGPASSDTTTSSGGLWSGLDSQTSNTSAPAPNPYSANPYYPTPAPPQPLQFGPTAFMPQQGYVPEASPLGMILGVFSVCMPLFVCFYGLSVPIGVILGIAAWMLSSAERKKAAQGIVRIGLADVGYILGIIGTIINGILLLIVIAFVVVVITAAANGNLN